MARETEQFQFQHIVTARHVIDGIGNQDICIRVNNVGPGMSLLHTQRARHWHVFDSKEYVDIAVAPLFVPSADYDVLHMDMGSDVIDPRKPDPPSRPGDEIFVVGLFTSHYGEARNIPIVRFGHISAMDEEPVLTEFGYMPGYLVELKSLGGLSGSPVFVKQIREGETNTYLLGVMHGHFLIENPEDAISVSGKDKPTGQINTGIGLVIPVKRVLDVLEQPSFEAKKRAMVDLIRRSSNVKADSAAKVVVADAPLHESDAKPTHREDFTSLLTAAVKRPARED